MPSLTDSLIYGPKADGHLWDLSFGPRTAECIAQCLNLEHEFRHTVSKLYILRAAQVVPWRHAYSNRLLVGDDAHGPPAGSPHFLSSLIERSCSRTTPPPLSPPSVNKD
jgi:hypothetical protein